MKMAKLLFVYVLVIMIAASVITFPVRASSAILGDADGDGDVCITDATKIQRDAAKITVIENDHRCSADVDGDGIITILDATCIQRWLARFSVAYPIGEPISNALIPTEESVSLLPSEDQAQQPSVIRNNKTVTVNGIAFNISKIPDAITLDNSTENTARFMLQNKLLTDPADVHIEISDYDYVRRIDYRDPRFKENYFAADDRKGIGCDYLISDNNGNDVAWVDAHLTNTACVIQPYLH